jgi:hypothetical protein
MRELYATRHYFKEHAVEPGAARALCGVRAGALHPTPVPADRLARSPRLCGVCGRSLARRLREGRTAETDDDRRQEVTHGQGSQ